MTSHPTAEPQGIMLRVEIVREKMTSWGLRPDEPGYIDTEDPASLDSLDPRRVATSHPAVPAYYDRILAESAAPAGEPDDYETLRRRAGR